MAVIQTRDTRTFIAGEDLSAAQFKFVTLESDGQVDLADSAGETLSVSALSAVLLVLLSPLLSRVRLWSKLVARLLLVLLFKPTLTVMH
jgi:hypothetical protein